MGGWCVGELGCVTTITLFVQVVGQSSSSNSNVNIVAPVSNISPPQLQRYNYSVKVINPQKKSEFEVESLRSKQKFLTLEEVKQQIVTDCKGKVPDYISTIGYIAPGHGLSGKKKWMTSDQDLSDMYTALSGKFDAIFWCYGPNTPTELSRGTKRPHNGNTEGEARKTSRYDRHVDMMAEVEVIEDKLREKHSEKFSEEQLRSWAHLIHMKKHKSYDEPPDKPFFRSAHKPNGSVVSPGKRINLRGQCVDQLLKSHQLLEKGVISQAQYQEFQESILKDVKKF